MMGYYPGMFGGFLSMAVVNCVTVTVPLAALILVLYFIKRK